MLLKVLSYAGISSIVFRVLYSEIFGSVLKIPWTTGWIEVPALFFNRHLNIGTATGHAPQISGHDLCYLDRYPACHARADHRHDQRQETSPWKARDPGDDRQCRVDWDMWGILLMIWAFYALPLMPDLTGLPVIAMGLNAAAVVGVVLLVAGILASPRRTLLKLVEVPIIVTYYHTPVLWRWAYPQSLSRWWSTTSRSA